MIEENNTSSKNSFWIFWSHAIFTKLDDLFTLFCTHYEIETRLGLVDVAQHLETNQMVIMDNFIVWIFDVKTQQVLENTEIKSFPMFVKNMSSLCLILEKKSHEVNKSYFWSFFGRLNHLNKFIDGFLGHILKLESAKPLFEIFNWSTFVFDSVWFNKLFYKLPHFV